MSALPFAAARWLWGTATFEMALAVFFVVLAVVVPEARLGFLITGAFLGVTALGLGFWGRAVSRHAARVSRLKAEGITGRASILSMRQTGLTINDQPQVELKLGIEGGRFGFYEAAIKEIMPLLRLATLNSGEPLTVKIDPADRTNFVIEWDGSTVSSLDATSADDAYSSAAVSPAMKAADKARILATGTPAKATVLESSFAGRADAHDQPIYTLTFQIEVPGRPVIHRRTEAGVPLDRIAQLQPGKTVALKVDRYNPNTMAIDWDATPD
jgi:hypothetical protein